MILIIKILFGLILLQGNNSVIENYLKQHLKDYKKFEYKIASEREITDRKFIFDETRKFKIDRNYAYIPVNYILENGIKSRGIITIKVKLYRDVFVTTRRIYKDEDLSAADFNVEEKEVSALRVDPISSIKNINKFRAKFNLSPKTVIGTNMVEVIPDVKIGDHVHAIYSKGIVNISFDAVARSNGIIGNIIKIKNEEKKIFRAKVISYNTVKIVE